MRQSIVLALLLIVGSLAQADIPTPYNTEKDTAGPMPAEEAARTMQLPPGFKCQVFAAEPDVQQPIAMAWDSRGRLWIAECYTYAEMPRRWDTNMRDRILIFEDEGNTGHFTKRTVFYDNATYLTSIEIGYDGVYMLEAGGLSFLADKNHDDKPDGPPQVLLDGFNTKTIGHNIVNGLKWGPDGWLYGRHGITDTSAIGAPGTAQDQRTRMNCGLFRFHPTKHTFEVVLNGGTNSWGHDWDANGELFWINTVIGHVWHGIPGAYNDRMFGTHLNPHVYETMPMIGDHWHFDHDNEKWADVKKGISNKTDSLGGGHAHVGCVIYNGGAWPDEYKGKLFTCNLHGNRINMDILERQGCGFVAKHGKDFMLSKDKWFRGIDLSTGPDGSVFVIDWSDGGECHDTDGIHRTSGRIYKISYGEPKKLQTPNVADASIPQLLEMTQDSNTWTVTQAQHRLFQDSATDEWWRSAYADPQIKSAFKVASARASKPDTSRLSLSFLMAIGSNLATDLHTSPSEIFRAAYVDQTTELISAPLVGTEVKGMQLSVSGLPGQPLITTEKPRDQQLRDNARNLDKLTSMSKGDASGLVRLHLASALQRLPLEARFPIATALASHAEDATDRDQPLMIWYGIEPAVTAHPEKALALALSSKIPTVRRLITRRLAEEIEKTPGPIEELLAAASKDENASARIDIVNGMAAALKGVSQTAKPKSWDAFAALLASDASLKDSLRELSLVFGSGRAADELIAIIKNADADANARTSAMASILRNPKPALFDTVKGLINDKILGTLARQGLAKFPDQDIPKALLNNWPERSLEWRAANINTLISRPAWTKPLLDAIEKGKLKRDEITPFQARQIHALNDADLSKLLTKVWGESRETPEAKQKEIAKWKQLLTPDAIAKADAAKGRLVFTGVCSACHKLYGEGAAIAPELTGSDRHNIDYLLGNIVDPNAVVPADYRVSVVKLKDGRILTGVLPEQNDRTITVQTPTERLSIERSQIASQEQLAQSLMPEGLLSALGEENVKHLIAYLMSNGQVAMPQAK